VGLERMRSCCTNDTGVIWFDPATLLNKSSQIGVACWHWDNVTFCKTTKSKAFSCNH